MVVITSPTLTQSLCVSLSLSRMLKPTFGIVGIRGVVWCLCGSSMCFSFVLVNPAGGNPRSRGSLLSDLE